MPFILSSELCSRIKALYRKTWYLNNPFHLIMCVCASLFSLHVILTTHILRIDMYVLAMMLIVSLHYTSILFIFSAILVFYPCFACIILHQISSVLLLAIYLSIV